MTQNLELLEGRQEIGRQRFHLHDFRPSLALQNGVQEVTQDMLMLGQFKNLFKSQIIFGIKKVFLRCHEVSVEMFFLE